MQLTFRDVAGMLNVPEDTVYRWITDKQLPAGNINGQFRFSGDQVFEWATLNHVEISPKALAMFGERSPEQIRLDAALTIGGILHDLPGGDANAVIGQIVNALPLPETFSRENLVQLIATKSCLRATAIGDGIAIPHPRLPMIIPGRPAAITLTFLSSPLANEGPDQKPIHTLFLLLAPTVRSHLQLLARLAFASRDARFRELLRRRAPAAEILGEAKRIEGEFCCRDDDERSADHGSGDLNGKAHGSVQGNGFAGHSMAPSGAS